MWDLIDRASSPKLYNLTPEEIEMVEGNTK